MKEGAKSKNPKAEAELAALAKLADGDIDTSDISETRNWSDAQVGRFSRPIKKVERKVSR